MSIAREGLREIVIAGLMCGVGVVLANLFFWPLALAFALAFVAVVGFFRDPRRQRSFEVDELCSPADGTVTEVTRLDRHDEIGGPATRIGIFLSIFSVHINRMPCSGMVRTISHRRGEFLDARHVESGRRNESNTLLIDPDGPIPGPIVVRQVAGMIARRIICHAKPAQHFSIGARFGMIKFGSRTELIIPRRRGTEVEVRVGDQVRAGLTILARQALAPVSVDESLDAAVPARNEEAGPFANDSFAGGLSADDVAGRGSSDRIIPDQETRAQRPQEKDSQEASTRP